jgi:hypothetical protein
LLQTNITAESTARTTEDTAINTRIDDLELLVATGSSIRGSFDTVAELDTLVEADLRDGYMYGIRDTNDVYVYGAGLNEYDYQPTGWTGGFIQFVNIADLTGAVADEAAARTTADTLLQTNIDAEATRATTAEGVLTTNLAAEVAAREAAIAQEVIDRNEAIRVGGSLAKLESLTVSGGKVTFTYEPKNGLNGVMNFGTVRYFDSANGHSYDAPLVATGNVKEFTVSTDTAGQWDGKSVQVQYIYVTPAV